MAGMPLPGADEGAAVGSGAAVTLGAMSEPLQQLSSSHGGSQGSSPRRPPRAPGGPAGAGAGTGKDGPPASWRSDSHFMISYFKVLPCQRRTRHQWRSCPFVHQGELVRRRSLQETPYNAVMCAYVRLGQDCPSGEACSNAHNVFELWLHPARFRTQLCSDGAACRRSICFFAHGSHELRNPENPESGAGAPPGAAAFDAAPPPFDATGFALPVGGGAAGLALAGGDGGWAAAAGAGGGVGAQLQLLTNGAPGVGVGVGVDGYFPAGAAAGGMPHGAAGGMQLQQLLALPAGAEGAAAGLQYALPRGAAVHYGNHAMQQAWPQAVTAPQAAALQLRGLAVSSSALCGPEDSPYGLAMPQLQGGTLLQAAGPPMLSAQAGALRVGAAGAQGYAAFQGWPQLHSPVQQHAAQQRAAQQHAAQQHAAQQHAAQQHAAQQHAAQQHQLMAALGAGALPLGAGRPQHAAHQQQAIALLAGGGSPLRVAAASSPTRLQL